MISGFCHTAVFYVCKLKWENMRMMVRWICPAIVSVCQDFPVKLSDEDDSQNRGSEC